MSSDLKQSCEVELSELARKRGVFTVYKHMLMQKKRMNSTFKNFLMLVYFLCYRISVELGTCELTWTENVIVTIFLVMVVFSLINQGARLICYIFTILSRITVEAFWIYTHIEEARKLMKDKKQSVS